MPKLSTETSDKKIYTVAEINRTIRALLEQQFGSIWIEGEISNFKHYPSGHMYFSLKDEQAQIRCVMFAGRNRLLTFKPQDGQHVLLKAKASLYEDRGDFQLLIDYMEEAGDGALKRAFELLKKQLAAEGLFQERYKKALPELPRCIGLVTSSRGAAIHDILITLERRFPSIPVIIYPTLVQGMEAPASIVKAIHLANLRNECDVLIVGRGGGSLEDLQAFNTEIVARAIFASEIPIISAVGHEVDVTIADFVADVRAATPTAAAELVSPDRDSWIADIEALREQLVDGVTNFIQQKMLEIDWLSKRIKHPGERLRELQERMLQLQKNLWHAVRHSLLKQQQQIEQLHARLRHHSPLQSLSQYQHHISLLYQKIGYQLRQQLQSSQSQLAEIVARLEGMSPLKTLSRGYAILHSTSTGKVIDTVQTATVGESITAQLLDGQLCCQVVSKKIN